MPSANLMTMPQRVIYPLKPGDLPDDTYLTEQGLEQQTKVYHRGTGFLTAEQLAEGTARRGEQDLFRGEQYSLPLTTYRRARRQQTMALSGLGQTIAGATEFRVKVVHLSDSRIPIVGAKVVISAPGSIPIFFGAPIVAEMPLAEGITGSNGEVLLQVAPTVTLIPGTLYSINVEAPGYIQKSQTAFPVGVNTVRLAKGTEGALLEFISITIIPTISGVNVTLWDTNTGMSVDLKKTDGNGSVKFSGVSARRDYEVTLQAAGYEPVREKIAVHNQNVLIDMRKQKTTPLYEARVTDQFGAAMSRLKVKLVRWTSPAFETFGITTTPYADVVAEGYTDVQGYISFRQASDMYLYVIDSEPPKHEGASVEAIPNAITRIQLKPREVITIGEKEDTGIPWKVVLPVAGVGLGLIALLVFGGKG